MIGLQSQKRPEQSPMSSVVPRLRKGYELNKRQGRPSAVVIGAGAVGLSTAVELLESGCDVCVVADTFPPQTTSDGSGGFWRPVYMSMEPEMLHRICKYSFQKMLAMKALHADIGIKFISGYEFYSSPPEVPVWSDIVFGFRRAEPAEIKSFCPNATHGFFYTTLMIEPSKYLTFLMELVKNMGGTFEQKKLSSLVDAAMVFVRNRDTLTMAHRPDFIVNCSGLGAATLVPDAKMQPIRGQIVKVSLKNPSDSRYFLLDLTDKAEATYVLPRDDCCILGGTEQRQDRRTEIDPADTVSIRRRCEALLPSLKDATVQSQWAGLRPGREEVRLEADADGIIAPFQTSSDGGITQAHLPVRLEADADGIIAPFQTSSDGGITQAHLPLSRLETDADGIIAPFQTSSDGGIIQAHLPVVHNYGHGGSGLTIHWGCATECVALTTQLGLLKTVCKL